MANYLGLKNKFLPNLKQYEATTGRPISDRAMQSYLYSALQTEADRKDTAYARERQFGLQQQGLDLQKKAAEDAASAAKISGITQLAGLPIQGALGYGVLKQAGLLGAKTAAAGTTGTAQGLLAGGAGTTAQGGLLTGGAASTNAGVIAANAAPASVGSSLLDAAPAAGALIGAQLLAAPTVQKYADKAGLPTAGKYFKYGGLPGAMVGGSIDVAKKGVDVAKDISSSVGNFFSSLF